MRDRRSRGALPARRLALAAAAAVLATALAGCSNTATALGEPLSVAVKSASDATDATLGMTVTGIEARPVAEVEQLDLGDDYEDGTLFLVTYTAVLEEGSYLADNTYELGDRKWNAVGTSDIAPVSAGFFGKLEVPGCEMFGAELAARLAAGEKILACQLFASDEPGAEIERIVYGAAAISYKGRGTGYSWSAGQ